MQNTSSKWFVSIALCGVYRFRYNFAFNSSFARFLFVWCAIRNSGISSAAQNKSSFRKHIIYSVFWLRRLRCAFFRLCVCLLFTYEFYVFLFLDLLHVWLWHLFHWAWGAFTSHRINLRKWRSTGKWRGMPKQQWNPFSALTHEIDEI